MFLKHFQVKVLNVPGIIQLKILYMFCSNFSFIFISLLHIPLEPKKKKKINKNWQSPHFKYKLST